MRSRLRHSRVLLGVCTLVLGLGAVGGAVVMAGDDDDTESGSLAEVRHALPVRSAPPEVVASGRTESGQAYDVLISRADRLVCVAVHYSPPEPTPQPAPVALRGSEFCADPAERPVGASMEQLFVDPRSGKVSETPQRFAYGIAPTEAATVVVEGPGGKAQELRVSDAHEGVKVFAGSVTGQPGGVGAVTAEDASGRRVGAQSLRFARPMHTSDAEVLRDHPAE